MARCREGRLAATICMSGKSSRSAGPAYQRTRSHRRRWAAGPRRLRHRGVISAQSSLLHSRSVRPYPLFPTCTPWHAQDQRHAVEPVGQGRHAEVARWTSCGPRSSSSCRAMVFHSFAGLGLAEVTQLGFAHRSQTATAALWQGGLQAPYRRTAGERIAPRRTAALFKSA